MVVIVAGELDYQTGGKLVDLFHVRANGCFCTCRLLIFAICGAVMFLKSCCYGVSAPCQLFTSIVAGVEQDRPCRSYVDVISGDCEARRGTLRAGRRGGTRLSSFVPLGAWQKGKYSSVSLSALPGRPPERIRRFRFRRARFNLCLGRGDLFLSGAYGVIRGARSYCRLVYSSLAVSGPGYSGETFI